MPPLALQENSCSLLFGFNNGFDDIYGFPFRTEGMKGEILMNENERDLSQFRKLSAYIMQDNQLHLNLTVDEAMAVAAKLKIGDKKGFQRESIISEILDTLGLLDHRRTMTSGLSGGQKKRLSIALELVSNPPIMFFTNQPVALTLHPVFSVFLY
ncbi:hypothetical protein NQ317_007379 [Molorchus minor]|uniref:ABC transporter domain-containing protein n=1 Tax=Molorchus minor TaxID=1323400 RepID=A0ABQ9IZ27_9CUCU|nr:hypothetical protein NQ317_007379 [Molorchus minor]